MSVPAPILKVAKKLFDTSEEQDSFVRSVMEANELPSAIISLKDDSLPFKFSEPMPAQPEFVKRLAAGERASSHPLHEAGSFYCLDYSSVFAASVMLAVPQNPEIILDACAAPGGKSIFAWKALSPKYLLSNEVVIGRAKALISNLKRCSIKNSRVLNLATEQLAERMPKACDLVVLDVPCSGQSLMVKGKNLSGTFRDNTVNGNLKRQRRILAQMSECVKPGGYIAYMTCTFSPEENEKNIDWFLKRFSNFEAVEVKALSNFRSHLSDFPSYRIWPHKHPVAGSFSALLKNKEEAEASSSFDVSDLNPIWES